MPYKSLWINFKSGSHIETPFVSLRICIIPFRDTPESDPRMEFTIRNCFFGSTEDIHLKLDDIYEVRVFQNTPQHLSNPKRVNLPITPYIVFDRFGEQGVTMQQLFDEYLVLIDGKIIVPKTSHVRKVGDSYMVDDGE